MKLSDIVNLKKMTYSDEIPNKHLQRMKQTPSLLNGFEWDMYMGQPPHDNDSSSTMIELKQLSDLESNDKFVEEMDNVSKVFKEYIEINGLDYPENLIEKLLEDSSIVVTRLKYHYNRPRPAQLAKHPLVNTNIGESKLMDSMKTPAYPSGHSTQGILIAMVLSDMYPEHEYNLMSLGGDISYSRNIARAHYPSDSKFGEKLGHDMFKYLKKSERL